MKHRAGTIAAFLAMAVHLISAPLSPLSASNGVFPTSNSPRSGGRGGADAAVANDAYAMFGNPAGITQLYGLHLSNSIGLFHASGLYHDPMNPEGQSNINRFYPDANGGLVLTPDFFDAARCESDSFSEAELMGFDDEEETWHWKKFRPAIPTPWRFGAGLFTQGGAGADFRNIKTRNYGPPPFPNGIVHRTKFALLTFAPTVAYQVDPTLSIGGSFNLNYGRIDLDMPFSQDASILQGPDLPGLPPAFNFGSSFKLIEDLFGDGHHEVNGEALVKRAHAWGWGMRYGVLWKPTDEWSFGAWWSSQTFMHDFKGEAHLDFDREIQNLPNSPFPHLWEAIIRAALVALTGDPLFTPIAGNYKVTIRNFQMPQRVAFGVAYRPNRDWLFTSDVKWINWSHTFKNFVADLTNGQSREFNVLIGSTSVHSVLPLNWHDQWVFAEGMEYRWDDDLTLRLGLNYGRNIIPSNTYLVIFPAITELTGSWGFSYRISPNTTLDASWEHAFTHTIRADSHLPLGIDYTNSRYTVDQDTVLFGIEYDF